MAGDRKGSSRGLTWRDVDTARVGPAPKAAEKGLSGEDGPSGGDINKNYSVSDDVVGGFARHRLLRRFHQSAPAFSLRPGDKTEDRNTWRGVATLLFGNTFYFNFYNKIRLLYGY